MRTFLPTGVVETTRCRSRGPSSAVPSNPTMTSFARTPPRSAGSPGMTSRTSTPRGSRSLSRSRSASVTSPMDTPSQPHSTLPFVASCDELLDQVGRDREADRAVARRHAVDTDHLARHVHERAAGVPGVDRGVGLDEVKAGRRDGEGRALTADDAERHALLEAERVAERQDELADT